MAFLLLALLHSTPAAAVGAGINSQLSFEGKVVKSDGTNIADGTYNMEFKIYCGGDGVIDSPSAGQGSDCTSSSNEHLEWTGDRLIGGTGGVTITSGTFQVNLGATNPFGTSVNWNWDTLWLSMQIGNTSSCTISTSFQSNCGGDGEMGPYIRLTAVPQSLNSSQLGGIAAVNYLQLATGNIQTDATTNTSVAINKTGASGNILLLEASGKTALTVNNSGAVILGQAGASGLAGVLTFDNATDASTATLSFQGNSTASYTYRLPTTVVNSNSCLQSGTVSGGIVPLTFASCGGATLASSYNASGTSGNTIALQNAGGGIIIQDASSSSITTLFGIQSYSGTTNYLAFGLASGTPHLKIYDSTGAHYADIYDSAGTAFYSADNGSAVLGNGTGPVSVSAGTGAAVTITGHANSSFTTDTSSSLTITAAAASTWSTGVGLLTIQGGGGLSLLAASTNAVTLDSGSTGGVNIGTGSNAKAIAIGSTTSGTSIDAEGSTIDLGDSTLTKTIDIGGVDNAATDSINLGTNAGSVETIIIGTTNSTSSLLLQGGSGDITLNTSSGNHIIIGSATPDANQVLLQLDSFNTYSDTATCASATNQGALYYNTATNSIRACVNSNWEDLTSTSGLGILLFGVVEDSGNTSEQGDVQSLVTAGVSGPCKVSWKSSTSVNVEPCIAYSGGRKIVVNQTTVTGLSGNTLWYHICLNPASSNGQPTTTTGNATETNNLPTFNVNNPIECLADIKTGSGSTITNIYDTRTYTNSLKQFVTANSAVGPGMIVIQGTSGTTGVVVTTTTGGSAQIRGVVAASSGTASATTVNAILTKYGMANVKATGTSSVGGYVETTTTAGYSKTITATTSSSAWVFAGEGQRTIDTTCTASSNCQYSQIVDLALR